MTSAPMQITVVIDGEPRSIYDLIWIFTATCSCAYGALIVNPGDDLILTEDQAWNYFEERKRRRDKRRAAGETAALRPRSEVMNMAVNCPHTPRFGHDVMPVPEGYSEARQWQSKVKHLVKDGEPLCGRNRYGHFYEDKFADFDMCATCDKRARKLVLA